MIKVLNIEFDTNLFEARFLLKKLRQTILRSTVALDLNNIFFYETDILTDFFFFYN